MQENKNENNQAEELDINHLMQIRRDKLVELQEEEKQLTIDVEKMQDPEYVGRYLREKYFYSKDGEYIIRIPEK